MLRSTCRSQPITRLAPANGTPSITSLLYLAAGPRHVSGQLAPYHLTFCIREEDKNKRSRSCAVTSSILTPSRNIGEYIFRMSITNRTVRPWLIMMMTSRHRVQWGHHCHHCLRPSDLHMASHSQLRQRLPNARQRENTETKRRHEEKGEASIARACL